ncbi:hypothetical protein JF50_18075 [Pseudoalteromonas luteoviolacea]|uniref:Uncharacterized protein n=1 Tax=Pseudoalteromonas luteoviolacea TaxID=43657 RepID=A0A0C1MH05_9GAMM|nr:hypothetical protein [Pseudoalteromonas luteoviolacea]KID56184.1 hypothetical protein JF50_18075 [Pseudoalteromonas luteoviolacea]
MSHYVIKGHDYEAFRDTQDELESLHVDNEDVSAICDDKPHPLHDCLTNHVVHLMKSELMVLITIMVAAYCAVSWVLIPPAAAIIGTIILGMFSLWVSGMIGTDLIRYYMMCKDSTHGEHHPLVLHVEIDDSQQETLKKVMQKHPQMNLEKLQ